MPLPFLLPWAVPVLSYLSNLSAVAFFRHELQAYAGDDLA
jgi:hypothetical protein